MRTSPAVLVLLGLLAADVSAAAEPRPAPTAGKVRTLDAITIEGAVDVPRVLFITSRDNVRFDDGLGWSFLPGTAEILEGMDLPSLIRPSAFAPDSESSEKTTPAEPALPEAKE